MRMDLLWVLQLACYQESLPVLPHLPALRLQPLLLSQQFKKFGKISKGQQLKQDNSKKAFNSPETQLASILQINEEIERSYTSINDKTNQFKAQLGNISRIDAYRRRLTQNENIEREESVIKAKELFAELKKIVREQDKLADKAAEYNRRAATPSGRFRAPGLPPSPPSGGGRNGFVPGSEGQSDKIAGFTKSLLAAAAAYVSLDQAARQAAAAINKSIQSASSEQRIRALADGFDDYEAVLFRASAAAEKFNISQIEANNQFAQLYGRLRPLGLTLSEIETVFQGFNTAASLTGATAAESAGALLQLSQALGAGALRGEEFNSIAEQAPAVLQAIAKEMDKPVGALKELAKEGEITSDIVVAALSRVKTQGADKLANALDTPAQKLQKLSNRFEDLQVAIGNLTLPAFIRLVEQTTKLITTATGRVDMYAEAFTKLAAAVDKVLAQNVPLQGLIRVYKALDNQLDEVAGGVDVLGGAFSRLPGEIAKALPGLGQVLRVLDSIDFLARQITKEPKTPRNFGSNYKEQERALFEAAGGYNPYADTRPLSERLGLGGGGSGGAGGGGGGSSAVDTLAQQLETGKELSREFSRQLQLLQATEGLERELLQIEFDRQDRMRSIADAAADMRAELIALSEGIAAAQTQDVAQDAFTEFYQGEIERIRAFAEAQKEFAAFFKEAQQTPLTRRIAELNAELKDTDQMIVDLSRSVESSLANGISGAVDAMVTGTKRVEDVVASMFETIAKAFLDMAAQIIAKQLVMIALQSVLKALGGPSMSSGTPIDTTKVDPGVISSLGGLKGYANGGTIPMGASAIVGEQGPEFLTLRPNGAEVIPNNPFVDAAAAMTTPGTDAAFADAGEAMEMAMATTMANITAKQEAQSLEAAAAQSNSTSTIRYESQVINDVRYVTEEQAVKIGQQSAKQAEANVYKGLRNMPATRGRAGVR